jgi:phage terminase large subunit GpA-like protein
MDAFNDPEIETVVVMASAQSAKTEALNNCVGYYMDQDPSPILIVEPTLDVAKSWSKDRLTPMLRDTPALKGRVSDARSKDPDSTLLHKVFRGGHLTIAGANSAASLRARPIRILLCDDIDAFPVSAGAEGDPIDLAKKRTTTFWNRKIGLFSTPTLKDSSRIELAYSISDKRRYYVPCPTCGEYQIMLFTQVMWPEGAPMQAVYHCIHCNAPITDNEKLKMLKQGEWRAEGTKGKIAGFWWNELTSPWVTFANMAVRFVEAQKNVETLRVFINTSLAETWEEKYETIDEGHLMDRRENYGPEIPLECGVLTCAVDVQGDHLEAEVVGWGKGKESWGIEHKILEGDPSRPEVWLQLDEYLKGTWMHVSGITLRIFVVCIDSGYLPDQVYTFVKNKAARHIIAIKGSSSPSMAKIISDRPTHGHRKSVQGKTTLYTVGTSKAKEAIYTRLRVKLPGPGYMHFPAQYTKDYFEQLTAERQKLVYRHGYPVRIWEKKKNVHNEILDIRVYNLAALSYLEQFTSFNLDKTVDVLLEMYKVMTEKGETIVQVTPQPIRQQVRQGRRVRSQGIGAI